MNIEVISYFKLKKLKQSSNNWIETGYESSPGDIVSIGWPTPVRRFGIVLGYVRVDSDHPPECTVLWSLLDCTHGQSWQRSWSGVLRTVLPSSPGLW